MFDVLPNARKQISIYDLAEFIFAHLDKTQEETIALIRSFVNDGYCIGVEWDEEALRTVLYRAKHDLPPASRTTPPT